MTTTTTPFSAAGGNIPLPIVQKLQKLIRRRRMVIVVRGLCAVLAVAIGSLLAVMGVDATVTIFAAWPRWALTGSAAMLTLVAAVLFLVRPLIRSFSLAEIARAIELRHPELHERISSAVELMSSTDSEAFRGSRFLIEALAREACQDVLAVAPKREVSLKAVRPFFVAAGIVAAVLALLMVVWPKSTGFLLVRALAPYKNLANVNAEDMTVAPGDITIASGSRLRVEVHVANTSVRRSQFLHATEGAAESDEEMTPLTSAEGDATRGFALTLAAAEKDFRYRVHAGDAVSRYYNVHVVPLPTAKSLDVIYDFPPYTQKAPEVVKGAEGDLRAIAGTQVTLIVQADAPLSSGQLMVNGQVFAQGQISPSAPSTCQFKMLLPARLNGRWAARLVRSENGQDFENFTPDHRVEALSDAPPTIKVVQPATPNLRLKPGEHLPISYIASDDVGLAGLEILTKIDGREQSAVPVALQGAAPHRLALDSTTLDLSKMNLTGASSVTFQLRVRDTLPADLKGPQEALSEVFTITLDVNSQPYAVQVTVAEEVVIRQLLQQLQVELTAAKQDSAPLQNALEKLHKEYVAAVKAATDKGQAAADVPQPIFSDASSKQVDRVRARLDSSAKLLSQLTEKVSGGTFAAMGEKIAQVDDHAKSADSFAAQIKVIDDAAQRKDKSERTDFHVYHALRIVNELLDQLHVVSELAQKAQQLEDMSNRQEDLAEAKAAMDAAKDKAKDAAASQPNGQTPPANANANDPANKPMSDQDWKQKENDLAAQLGQMAKKSSSAVAEEAKRDADKVRDLSAEARKQAEEQKKLAKESDLLTKMKEIEQQRKALAAEQTQLANETKPNKAAQDEAGKMAAAAQEIAKGDLDKAVAGQKDAQKGLEDKAKPNGPNNTPTPENAAAGAMAPREADLAKRTSELNDKAKALQKELGDDLARLKDDQKQIAKEAGELSDQAKATAPRADESDTKAAMAAKKASEKLDEGQPQEAVAPAQEAAKHLEKMAHDLGKEAGKEMIAQKPDEAKSGDEPKKPDESGKPDDKKPEAKNPGDNKPEDKKPDDKKPDDKKPDVTAQGSTEQKPQQVDPDQKAKDKAKLADKAADLAQRQKNVADEIQALSQKQPTEMAAAKQKELGDKSDKLADAVKLLQQHADELMEDPAAKQEANQAANEMAQATAHQKAAGKQLKGKDPQGAKPSQDTAAASLEKTAAGLERLGQKLAEAANKKPKPDAAALPDEASMDEAYDETRKAAATEELTDAALAAKYLAELAKQAAENAKAKGADPGAMKNGQPKNSQPKPSWAADSKFGAGLMAADLSPAELQAMGINLKDWARLPGHLKDEVLQAAEENVPEEYRQLVKHYFQEIARRGGGTDKK